MIKFHSHGADCFDFLVEERFCFDAGSDDRLWRSCRRREGVCRALWARYGIPWERTQAPANIEEMAFLDATERLSPVVPRPNSHRRPLFAGALSGDDLRKYRARLAEFVPILLDVLENHNARESSDSTKSDVAEPTSI